MVEASSLPFEPHPATFTSSWQVNEGSGSLTQVIQYFSLLIWL